jgi:hypothetical protein
MCDLLFSVYANFLLISQKASRLKTADLGYDECYKLRRGIHAI